MIVSKSIIPWILISKEYIKDLLEVVMQGPQKLIPQSQTQKERINYFLCHNLRSERNSCLPQALNIAFGQNIFISKKDYINQIGEFYKEAIDEKLNVFNWSAQELRVNGISWKWSNLADSNQFVHSQLSNDEIKRLLVKEISDFTTDNIGKFKQNQW